MIKGVYKITNTMTRQAYVGSSYDCYGRWRQHEKALRAGNHHSAKLQAAWNTYGGTAFRFGIIEQVYSVEKLQVREQHWIDELGAYEQGYNATPVATRPNTLSDRERAHIAWEKRFSLYDPKYERRIMAKPLVYDELKQQEWEDQWAEMLERRRAQKNKGWLVFISITGAAALIHPAIAVSVLIPAAIVGFSIGEGLKEEVWKLRELEPRGQALAERRKEVEAEQKKRRRPHPYHGLLRCQ